MISSRISPRFAAGIASEYVEKPNEETRHLIASVVSQGQWPLEMSALPDDTSDSRVPLVSVSSLPFTRNTDTS